MDILLTNDDGISSRGLSILAEWADTLGRAIVAAPASEQSAKSQSLNIRTRYSVKEAPFLPGIPAFAVDSTPADCILTAQNTLGLSFDIVFSGINRGYNLGWDIAYSGTCGAVFEAGQAGVPAIAFSTTSETFGGAYYHLDEVWSFIEENALLKKSLLWNINFPPKPEGIRLTYQSGPALPKSLAGKLPEGLMSDREAIRKGLISVSPLTLARTDFDALL
ncbi:MAG: 5'/3'-nucleotidase SurE, partial [Lachnospiraceae bacterium]